MARDNFNKPVIEKLKARVAHRCSNPSCRVPTSAPSAYDGVNNIGIAAHICAASPGGPRYDRAMTADERKSIDNAIWLCSNCSIDIDRDEIRYAVNLLKNWKEQAESSARAELGKKLPSHSETIDTVATVLTGFPKTYIANAISNVHRATAQSLESLDPRFLVKTRYGGGQTSIGIYAKENVSLSMNIVRESAKEFMEKHRQLIEHGKDVEIESGAITFEGSKLFEEVFGNNGGVFFISSKKIQATNKLWLVQKSTNIIEAFDDIQGTISLGTKSITFQGVACKGLLNFSFQKSLDQSDDKANLAMSLCLDRWEGVNLRYLPYFEKLLSLFDKMAQGWEVFTSLEIDGIKVLSSTGMTVDKWDYALNTNSFLQYVNRCRIISKTLQCEIDYTSTVSFTSEEHRYLADVAEIMEGKQEYQESDISSNATCELVVGEDCKNVKEMTALTEPSTVRMEQRIEDNIKLFGIEFKLPTKIIRLDSVIPKIHGGINKLKTGDVVKVEWLPQKDFKFSVSYESV